MTLGDLLVLATLLTVAFFAGRITMMRSIIRAVIEEHQDSEDEAKVLKIEKIGGVYYAYVNTDFAGQAANFDELFDAMSKNRKFGEWKLKEFPEDLSSEERELMLTAIEKHFTRK